MSLNEHRNLFEGYRNLVITFEPDEISVIARLPWLPKRRARAHEERAGLLKNIRAVFRNSLLIYEREGRVKHASLSASDPLDGLQSALDLGGWMMIFCDNSRLATTEFLAEGALELMSPQGVLQSSKASCIIVSEPDNIEWTILFSKR